MDAKSSAGVPLSSPAAAQRCAKGAGLDSGAAAAAQSAMPSIALPATASTADLLSTNAAAPAAPQLPSVSNLHQLDGRDRSHRAEFVDDHLSSFQIGEHSRRLQGIT
jgi:hypothetical protein